MKDLEEILAESLGVEYKPMTEKEKIFWTVSTKDCLGAMRAAVHQALDEAADEAFEAYRTLYDASIEEKNEYNHKKMKYQAAGHKHAAKSILKLKEKY